MEPFSATNIAGERRHTRSRTLGPSHSPAFDKNDGIWLGCPTEPSVMVLAFLVAIVPPEVGGTGLVSTIATACGERGCAREGGMGGTGGFGERRTDVLTQTYSDFLRGIEPHLINDTWYQVPGTWYKN